MGELSDVLGDDFEEKYESETQRRREQKNKVSEDELMAICHEAVNGDGFDGEEPRFRYEGGEVPHDVLLMETYDGDLGKFKNSFENGGMSLGMFHLDELMSCTFSEDMLDVVNKIKSDSYYIVVGKYEEKTVQTDGEKKTYYNVNPVRGIVPLAQAKKLAQNYKEDKGQSSVEEQQQDQGVSEDSEEETEEDTESVPSDEMQVLKVFEAIADKKPEILQQVSEGDDEAFNKLVQLVDKNAKSDIAEDTIYDTFEAEIEEIDDEEEEDDVELGGLMDSDDEESDESDETDGSDDENDSSDDDEEDEEEESVDDWF